MADGISPATLVFPIFNFALRSIRTGYEIASVPDEAHDLLKTISQSLSDVRLAKDLRKQKCRYLQEMELARVDQVIKNTEDAMTGLEALVESARVDMETRHGRVGVRSRIMWVMRDSNKVEAALGRLMLASQSLQGEMNVMRTIHRNDSLGDRDHSPVGDHGRFQSPPPTYMQATLDGLHERRRWEAQRRSSRSTLRPRPPPVVDPVVPEHPAITVMRVAVDESFNRAEASAAKIAECIMHNEAMVASISPSQASATLANWTPAVAVQIASDTPYPEGFYELDSAEIPRDVSKHTSWTPGSQYELVNKLSAVTLDIVPESLPLPATAIAANPPQQTFAVPTQSPPNILSNTSSFSQRSPRPYAASSADIHSAMTSLRSLSAPSPPFLNPSRHSSSGGSSIQSSPLVSPSGRIRILDSGSQRIQGSKSASPGSALMESHTFIPGHKKPMKLRWIEPTEERKTIDVEQNIDPVVEAAVQEISSLTPDTKVVSDPKIPSVSTNEVVITPPVPAECKKRRFIRRKRKNNDVEGAAQDPVAQAPRSPHVPIASEDVHVKQAESVAFRVNKGIRQRPPRSSWQMQQN